MWEHARELLEVNVSLARARPSRRSPLEYEAAVGAVHQERFMSPFENSPREHEIYQPVPSLRDPLETLDCRHEVLNLDDVRDREVRDGVDDDHRVMCVLVEEGDELLQDVRGRPVEYVVLVRPRGGHHTVSEVDAREVLENRVIPEGAVRMPVEVGRELLQEDVFRPGERHVADLGGEVGVVATVSEVVVPRL